PRTAVAATKGANAARSSTPAALARAMAAASTLTVRSGAMAGAASTAQTVATRWPSSDSRQAGGPPGCPYRSTSTTSPSVRSSASSRLAVAGSSQVSAWPASASDQLGSGSPARWRVAATLTRVEGGLGERPQGRHGAAGRRVGGSAVRARPHCCHHGTKTYSNPGRRNLGTSTQLHCASLSSLDGLLRGLPVLLHQH